MGRVEWAVGEKHEGNQILAVCNVPLRPRVPAELANLMVAPFSWPSGSALKDAVEEAGFREDRLLTPTLPMLLEGRLDQAIRSFSARAVSPPVAPLPPNQQQPPFPRSPPRTP